MADINCITGINFYPSSTIVVTGDFNSLNTDFLAVDFDFVHDQIIHGNRILDRLFIRRPHLYNCRIVFLVFLLNIRLFWFPTEKCL